MNLKGFGILALLWACVIGKDASPSDYNKLVEYVNIVSFSYCKGLQKGPVGNKNSHCPAKRCADKKFKNLEVLEMFDFNNFNSVGAGFKGIDHVHKRIILAFRGTSTTREWMTDFNVPLMPYAPLPNLVLDQQIECDDCKVHRGFYNFVQENCVKLIQSVHELKEKYPDYQVVTVGHSLGGTFALLSGIEFKLMGYDPLVLTYASPKVGNQALMDYIDGLFGSQKLADDMKNNKDFDTGYIRVVHKNDVVTMLPPRELGYRHAGVEYVIQNKKLPHLPGSLELRGMDYFYDNDSESAGNKLKRITKSLSKIFDNFEHAHYFIKIPGCK